MHAWTQLCGGTVPPPQVLTALREVGRALGMAVRPYSVTPGAAFPSFVASMASTGVLVARHGPLLANALFLPPGAAVLELLPYNWEWRGISEIYLNLTRSVGSLHHFAWKANSSEVRPGGGRGGAAIGGGSPLLGKLPGPAHQPTSCGASVGRLGVWRVTPRVQQQAARPGPLHSPPPPPPPPPRRLQWVLYLEAEDAKYSHWTAEECSSRCGGGGGGGGGCGCDGGDGGGGGGGGGGGSVCGVVVVEVFVWGGGGGSVCVGWWWWRQWYVCDGGEVGGGCGGGT
jgi:hypothetical protein